MRPTLLLGDARKLADGLGRPCLIPIIVTVDGYGDPALIYMSMRRPGQPSYLLESVEGPGESARYSIIGCNPLLHVVARGDGLDIFGRPDVVELSRARAQQVHDANALEMMKEAMFLKIMDTAAEMVPRYILGAVGYISYDMIRSIVNIGANTTDDLNHPDVEFMLAEQSIVLDHLKRQTNYCSLMLLTDGTDADLAYEQAMLNIKKLMTIKPKQVKIQRQKIVAKSNIPKSKFERDVEVAKRYIRAGDIIQVVLSRRIELKPAPQLGQFYVNLRKINPSPYMFFLDFPERSVTGSSPEILVKVDGRKVVTRPIAGTRRRGNNETEDLALERDLLMDEKERAEHIMLVDLGRNDIGRVSEFGTVKLPEFMEVEKYSHVQHIVTTVVGRMRAGKDAFDAFRATFPAGTVTGAPKVRAMEIIEELEPTRRGIYAGAVGSFSYGGQADLAITIRTLVAERGRGHIQVGAGIVADSVPWKEHYETENKARALLQAAGV